MQHRSDERRRGLAWGLRAIWLGAGALAVAGALVLVVVVHVLGLTPLAVRGGSMEPAIPVGSLILVEQVDPADVRVGDVLTFDPPGAPARTTHRVVERTKRGDRWYFRTKGDANDVVDDWRRGQRNPSEYERGVTYGTRPALRTRWHVPHAGVLADLTSHRTARVLLFGIPLVLLTANALVAIWHPRGGGHVPDDAWRDRRTARDADLGFGDVDAQEYDAA